MEQKGNIYFKLKLIAVLLMLASLSWTCSRKKSTFISRAYHNTTSRYNGYFNAKELMKVDENNLWDTKIDDYSQTLPIFLYPDEKESQALYPDMDKIIEKCSQVITRHTIYLKKKEHVKWIDDCYFLIGKARFYKMEYTLAEETFLYIYQSFKQNPSRFQGLVWLIRTFIETEQWEKAEEFLDLAEAELNKIPEEYKGELLGLFADYYLQKDKDIVKAITYLEDAIKNPLKKREKRRFLFVLAQLQQKQRDFSQATKLYTSVIKMNPSYVMQFNARINRAIAYDVSSNNSSSIKKELGKMLKDKKNEEFRDQIYYALAELALKEDEEPKAIEYLKLSAKFSVSNDKQKALSYFKLAELYFNKPNYVLAQAYYDSTIQFLPDDHQDYYEADEKNNNLQELVTNLKVIIFQDSVLALGQLDEKDREKKVKKIIKALQEEEERKKQAEMNALEKKQIQSNLAGNFSPSKGRTKGSWYFYNVTTMALGLSKFKQMWGERKLEDNWNRSKKGSVIIAQTSVDEEEVKVDTKADSLAEATKYDPEQYLKNIPVSFEEQMAAHGKIVEALFNVGTIFKESFLDYPSAIKSFKRITVQYDTSRYNLPAHYQLYRIYTAESEDELAEEEKKWILENHPFSEYAYLIKNPNYSKESKETKQKVEEYYQATYRLYEYGLYKDVIESCNRAEGAFVKNHLRPQFSFLKAKSIGYVSDLETYKKALEFVVTEFEKDPVGAEAKRILAVLNKKPTSTPTEEKPSFEYNPAAKHLFVFSMSRVKNNNNLKNKISNFNSQYFREKKLEITATNLGGRALLMVKTFENEADAARYYNAVRNNSALILLARQDGAEEYLISVENFRILFQSKDEESYKTFFQSSYNL